MIIPLILVFLLLLASLANIIRSENVVKIDRPKTIESILEIESVLNLSDSHYKVELDRMPDADLSALYEDLGQKLDAFTANKNAKLSLSSPETISEN